MNHTLSTKRGTEVEDGAWFSSSKAHVTLEPNSTHTYDACITPPNQLPPVLHERDVFFLLNNNRPRQSQRVSISGLSTNKVIKQK